MVAALLAALLLVAACAGGAGRAGQERKAREVEPAQVVATETEGGRVIAARVRVYADSAHRSQNPGHDVSIRRLLERASEVLEPTIGVRLELAEVRSWERQSGEDLDAALSELENLDPADDVDWVIGMVGALTHVASELHQLGQARVLGRHLVLRGLNDAAEVALFAEALGSLDKRQRQELYARRKRHKELILLLHELGHTLGAMHVADPGRLLYPSYDSGQAAFGRDNAQLMRVAATARFALRGDRTAEWRAVLGHIRKSSFTGWNEDEKARLLAELAARVTAVEEGAAGLALSGAVRPADREKFRTAERLHGAGKPHEAWEELEPLIEFYPAEPAVQLMACRLVAATGRDAKAVAGRCGAAAKATPDDPEPALRLAQSHLAAQDRAAALRAAHRARTLARAQKTGVAAPVWKELAALYQELGAVTWTEEAARSAGGVADAEAWARATRARYGLAPGGPVAPEAEAEYVQEVRGLLELVYGQRFAEAEKRAARLRRRFGDTAGLRASLCDLEIRRRRYPQARTQCAAALKAHADTSWAHYLTGLLDQRDRKEDAALQHLERAIALDAELKHAYQVAAELYKAKGRAGDEKRVRDAFQKQFGRPLP